MHHLPRIRSSIPSHPLLKNSLRNPHPQTPRPPLEHHLQTLATTLSKHTHMATIPHPGIRTLPSKLKQHARRPSRRHPTCPIHPKCTPIRNQNSNSLSIQDLLLDGLYMGCLFCQLDDGLDQPTTNHTFFYLHKIDILLLDNLDHSFHLSITNNSLPIYQKHFHIHYKNK